MSFNQICNNNKYQCECKNSRKLMCKKGYIWNPVTCGCENDRYAKSIIGNSVIACDEFIEKTKSIMTKTVPTNSNE